MKAFFVRFHLLFMHIYLTKFMSKFKKRLLN